MDIGERPENLINNYSINLRTIGTSLHSIITNSTRFNLLKKTFTFKILHNLSKSKLLMHKIKKLCIKMLRSTISNSVKCSTRLQLSNIKYYNIHIINCKYLERGFSFNEAVLIGGEAHAVDGEGCITPHKLPLILALMLTNSKLCVLRKTTSGGFNSLLSDDGTTLIYPLAADTCIAIAPCQNKYKALGKKSLRNTAIDYKYDNRHCLKLYAKM
ncbi:hypothetical protein AGLY_012658 [Aphis glycines]|uniref:Uncharacterized protein n=1 Tax=Aphis glycines TaxID=307491 RepID=A0A6G0T9W2_APHGL|nr:hypothetical protein AGLY_012658 [Aphis glycines]